MVFVFALQNNQCILALPQYILFPCDEFAPEIVPLALIHESFVFGRMVGAFDLLDSHLQVSSSKPLLL